MACAEAVSFSVNVAASSGIRLENPLRVPDWNARVQTHSNSGFFHSSEWAAVLESTYRFTPAYFTASIDSRMMALLPIMEVNSPLTGRRGVSLPFTDECEPLGSAESPLGPVFQNALDHGRNRKWKYLECRGHRAAAGLPGIPLPSLSFFTHRLQLCQPPERLFERFEGSVRRSIRKSVKAGVTVEFSQDLQAVRDFYRLHCQTRKRHGLPPQPFLFFLNIHRFVLSQDLGIVAIAKHQQRPIAAAVFFHWGSEATYKFGASCSAFQHLRPNNLVMWEAIRHHAMKGAQVLHFGRTSMANEGLRRFKLGWGADEQQQHYYKFELRTNAFAKDTDATAGWHTHVFRALPSFLSRLAGAVLYRHMA